jgi:proprotein convertase subtilisin/kexin type 5
LACFYTCQTCTNATDCVTCSPITFRTLTGTQCSPLPGYYDNNVTDALPCVSPCVNCTAASSCLSCIIGYYLTGTTCTTCNTTMPFCSTCTPDGSACTYCDPGYILNTTSGVCDVVPCIDLNCIECFVSTAICTACRVGFVVSNSACITLCGDNITAGTEQCDDGNTADGDGCNRDCTTGNNNGCAKETPYRDPITNSCIAVCPNRFFPDPTVYTCLACFYTCQTCTNATDCVTCSAATFRTLNGTACSPLPGYYDNNVTDALPCVSPCVNCTAASSCLSCVSGFYLSGTSCLACSTITTNCLTCAADGSACITCDLGFIYNTTTQLCDVVPCYDLNCLACPNSMAVCIQCITGFQPINGVCTQVCGDFIKTST